MADILEEVQNSNARLAYELWERERFNDEGTSPPKRHYDDNDYDSGSPTKLQKTAGGQDPSKIHQVNLEKAVDQVEHELVAYVLAASCVDM